MRSDEERERAPDHRPRGLAAAIVFDWAAVALFVALLATAIAQRGATSRQAAAAAFLALIAGLPLLGLGETLRRGRRGARLVQIAVSTIFAFGNTAGLLRDLGELARGEIPRTINLPSLLASSFIIWGLTRPQTIAWFASTTPARARALHGGRWLLAALGASVAFGLAAAFVGVA